MVWADLGGQILQHGRQQPGPVLREVLAGDGLDGLAQLGAHQGRRSHDALQQIVPDGRLVAVRDGARPLCRMHKQDIKR